jgi:hypothetical protein
MPVSKTSEAPEWIENGATPTGGLDLLGLRLPVQTIGLSLLNGVTTVTPSIRYIAIRAWLIHRYSQAELPDSANEFTKRSSNVECALVLGNLLQDRSMTGLIGFNEALERLNAGAGSLGLGPLVKTPASNIYAGASDQLLVSWSREDGMPGLGESRGLPLALAVEGSNAGSKLVRSLFQKAPLEEALTDDLKEFGAAMRIDKIPDEEREALVAAIIPMKPKPSELNRVATYTALLRLSKEKGALATESDLFKAACSHKRFGDSLLDQAADGWLTYCVRDLIAVSQAAVLGAVLGELNLGTNENQLGIEGRAIISELLSRAEEHNAPMREFGLLNSEESVKDISFGTLFARIEERLALGMTMEHGIRRWDSGLNEPFLYGMALRSGAGALSIAVVAWIVAALRVGSGVREQMGDLDGLSYQGWRRVGLKEVILPELERHLREDLPLTTVAADIAYRVVQQHLKIAWSRLQVDLTRDVSLLSTEGNKWVGRGEAFGAGRTASRIDRALGWMNQLGLVGTAGITGDGDAVLKNALSALSQAVPA